MQLWPAIIASPPPMRRMLMAYLIIEGHSNKRQPEWRGEGARGPALWHTTGLECAFFCAYGGYAQGLSCARAEAQALQGQASQSARTGGEARAQG